MTSCYATFFTEFLRCPKQVGTLIPSSRYLERRIVREGELHRARRVVELGPGTGGTTRAILKAMPATSRLLAIESNPRFAAALGTLQDPRLQIHQGRAERLGDVLDEHLFDIPDVVVSGIPFSTMPRASSEALLRSIWNGLPPGGRFVAYQMRGHVEQMGNAIFGWSARVQWEWRNVPPLRVYRWQKPADQTAIRPDSIATTLRGNSIRDCAELEVSAAATEAEMPTFRR